MHNSTRVIEACLYV